MPIGLDPIGLDVANALQRASELIGSVINRGVERISALKSVLPGIRAGRRGCVRSTYAVFVIVFEGHCRHLRAVGAKQPEYAVSISFGAALNSVQCGEPVRGEAAARGRVYAVAAMRDG